LGAVAGATGLLETATRILGRLRKAYARQKGLADILDRHDCELKSLKTIIEIIDDEDVLQTATVTLELNRLKAVERKLVELLRKLDTGSQTAVKQYAHQLVHGSSEEKKLSAIMAELCHVKTTLLLRIQVASVGVMRRVGNIVLANADDIKRIDSFLREQLGEGMGLKIAQLLTGKQPSINAILVGDGTVPLTLTELASINSDEDDTDSNASTLLDSTDANPSTQGKVQPDRKTERIILRNATRDQAVMLNGPIGKDLWVDIARLEVVDNTASGDSMMFNYATSMEVFKTLVALQTNRLTGGTGREG
ncbi:hypothetical protein EJ08DRAFT_579382, partial [Tothia fuscella]